MKEFGVPVTFERVRHWSIYSPFLYYRQEKSYGNFTGLDVRSYAMYDFISFMSPPLKKKKKKKTNQQAKQY